MTVPASSRIQARAVREVTPGILPAGNMTVIPWATFAPKSSFTRGTPDDVNSHGQAEDNPAEDLQVSAAGAGDYRIGLRDMQREEVFRNTFSAAVTITSTAIAAVAAGNKLTRTGGWGARAAGDLVWVADFVTNGASFAALVSAVAGDDLTLEWPTLVNEAAGPSVTVSDLGQLPFGTSLLTAYWETWNFATSKGDKWPGHSASQWDMSWDFPGRVKENFNFMGMVKKTRLAAQLANGTTAALVRRIVNSNTNFGDKTVIGSQMGFRYQGALMTNLIIESLKLSVVSPKQTVGGGGTLGPQDIGLDGLVVVKLDMKALRSGTDVDTLIDDAGDENAEKKIGFGYRDPDAKRAYIYSPRWQPFNGDADGIKRNGPENGEFSWVARYDATHSSLRYANLT